MCHMYTHRTFSMKFRRKYTKGCICVVLITQKQVMVLGLALLIITTKARVTFNLSDGTIECSCRGFTRIGYMCRHIFCVFRNMNVDA
ncbi:putative Zinc finger, SWIM-type [Helianthus annuus]|nr:putative Zinc finger, SWIM-type [Helianthus annuus]KAJ0497870.1 putative Zinc finger, SWIM-type [Helianthus annuus]KAJ0663878.1 putative Zinc finger, SWIM-type [Helianthus annuus]KAJ0671366.1 putative Zinc finger, SWIM-type [Helianthus annuus]KAJ0858410.1 putative Zinc finger, SWIM-type [Helianthus annuus]